MIGNQKGGGRRQPKFSRPHLTLEDFTPFWGGVGPTLQLKDVKSFVYIFAKSFAECDPANFKYYFDRTFNLEREPWIRMQNLMRDEYKLNSEQPTVNIMQNFSILLRRKSPTSPLTMSHLGTMMLAKKLYELKIQDQSAKGTDDEFDEEGKLYFERICHDPVFSASVDKWSRPLLLPIDLATDYPSANLDLDYRLDLGLPSETNVVHFILQPTTAHQTDEEAVRGHLPENVSDTVSSLLSANTTSVDLEELIAIEERNIARLVNEQSNALRTLTDGNPELQDSRSMLAKLLGAQRRLSNLVADSLLQSDPLWPSAAGWDQN